MSPLVLDNVPLPFVIKGSPLFLPLFRPTTIYHVEALVHHLLVCLTNASWFFGEAYCKAGTDTQVRHCNFVQGALRVYHAVLSVVVLRMNLLTCYLAPHSFL